VIRAGNVQVWLGAAPIDMRRSFDGLAEHVRAFLGHDPLSGSMFVFRNRSSQRVKILWWDQDGLLLQAARTGHVSVPRRRRSEGAVHRLGGADAPAERAGRRGRTNTSAVNRRP
jgi:transposase